MKAKKRLTEHQSGNKAMHSTKTINVMMTDQMLQAMDDKKLSIVVLLDFSKACNSIDHNKLLSQLKSLGTSSFALHWFRSSLKDRRQYVRIGSEHSTLWGLSHGVHQGSILGPVLFDIYILVIVHTTAAPARQSAALFLFANYYSGYRTC